MSSDTPVKSLPWAEFLSKIESQKIWATRNIKEGDAESLTNRIEAMMGLRDALRQDVRINAGTPDDIKIAKKKIDAIEEWTEHVKKRVMKLNPGMLDDKRLFKDLQRAA